MPTVSVASSPSGSPETENASQPDKKADRIPPPPKIGWIERATRLLALPVSFGAGIAAFYSMSRNGVKELYEKQGKLKKLNEEFDKKFAQADAHSDPAKLSKRIGTLHQELEEAATKLMRKEGFTNTLRYFNGNTHSGRLNILINTGAAFSITVGLFTAIADPRNRAAVSGLFRRLRGQQEQSGAKPQL